MKKISLLLIVVLCLFCQAKADDALTLTAANHAVTENFDGMWDAATSTATLDMPTGWRVERQMGAPRMVGAYSGAAAQVMYTGGTSLASNAKNGTWNFGSSTTPSDRAVGGLSTTIDGGTRCVNVMTQLVNGGTQPINQLTISYDIEKYRKGDNDAGFTVQLYFSYDGTTWKKAGDAFKTVFDKDNETLGAEVVPISTTAVNNKQLNTAVAVGSSIYLAWNISVSSGTSPNKAMGLALDNVRLDASFGEPQVDPNGTPAGPPVLQQVVLMPAQVTLVPQLPAKVKVLSLNNSLIHYNDQDFMFNDIAKAMNKDAHWTKHTLLGKPLSTHWDEGDGLAGDGNPGAKMLIRSEAWSHIILQEQSGLPRTNIEAFRTNIKKWVAYIREYCPNPNAVIIVPLNWAYSGDWTNFTDFNNTFVANYLDVARETGVTICPVGVAYQQVFDAEGTEGIASWFQDDRHPTNKSTYMAACMEYGLIFGADPTTISYHPASITDAEAASMRTYAASALQSFTNIVNHTAATIRYQAVGIDQYGDQMAAPTDLVYSLADGGALDANHMFTSNGTEGSYTVTAKNDQFTAQATVKVAHAETTVTVFPAMELNADKLTAEETFDAMGTDAEAALPEAWRIDRQTAAPRVVGTYDGAQTNSMYAGGVSLPSNAKNGLWNFGPDGSSDRAIGGITTGVADGTRCVNVYAHFLNTGKKNIENLRISYDVEKYRKGSNPAGFTVQMYYSVDGRNWTSAGDAFCTKLDADAATEGYATVPGEVIPVSAVLNAKMQPGVDFYLAWNITVASGDAANNAMALAIDNFKLTGELPAVPTAKHYIYVIDETGYDALGLYAWGTGELFGAWPGESWVDEKNIDGQLYKVFLLDAESGSYSLIFNNWNNGKQVPDFGITANRDYYLRVTGSAVTELTPTAIQSLPVTTAAPSTVYDLLGRRVGVLGDRLPKGLYVANGKKFIIK